MSLEVLTQGGGAGGETASIFITGLSEADTVTAVKDGKTVQGKWGESVGQKLEALIPAMTSNTTPSGTASATSYRSGYLGNAYHAFDRNGSTAADVWYGQAYSLDTKIAYTFDAAKTNVQKITLYAHIDGEGTLTSGVIEYTEDGSVWKTLTALNSSNFANYTELTFEVSVERMLGIRVGATASSNGRGMIVGALQVYGLVDHFTNGFKIEPIKSYGMWTVTATNGEKTTTQDVLVDAAVEYAIFMDLHKLWLYREGDECEDVTGGWYKNDNATIYGTSSANGVVEFQDDNIFIVSTAYNAVCVTTNHKISFANYTKFGFVITEETQDGAATVGFTMLFAASTNNGAITTGYALATYADADGVVKEVDISNLNDSFYISYATNGVRSGHLNRLWLE